MIISKVCLLIFVLLICVIIILKQRSYNSCLGGIKLKLSDRDRDEYGNITWNIDNSCTTSSLIFLRFIYSKCLEGTPPNNEEHLRESLQPIMKQLWDFRRRIIPKQKVEWDRNIIEAGLPFGEYSSMCTPSGAITMLTSPRYDPPKNFLANTLVTINSPMIVRGMFRTRDDRIEFIQILLNKIDTGGYAGIVLNTNGHYVAIARCRNLYYFFDDTDELIIGNSLQDILRKSEKLQIRIDSNMSLLAQELGQRNTTYDPTLTIITFTPAPQDDELEKKRNELRILKIAIDKQRQEHDAIQKDIIRLRGEREWACPACTFNNPENNIECAICKQNKPPHKPM